MSPWINTVACACLFAAMPASAVRSDSQDTPATTRGDTPLQTPGVGASRVALDVVVRDSRGRLVRDLSAHEVEVYEDGVRQDVLSMHLVDTGASAPVRAGTASGGAAAGSSEPGARPTEPGADVAPALRHTAASPAGSPLYLAFLFDRLSPAARHLAHDAAIEWLERPLTAGLRVGVFRIDQTLESLQTFTDDRAAAAEAVGRMLQSTPSAFHSAADRQRLRGLRQAILLLTGGEPSPQATPGSLPVDADTLEATARTYASQFVTAEARAFEAARLRLEMGMLEASEALERDQQGLATVNALLALVNGLRHASGRKAVVFFSEGLQLPPRVASAFQSVVSEANRGGVTFYAADAGGLRTQSASDESRRELAGLVEELRQGADESGLGSRAMTRVLERNEDLLRFDPTSGLGSLARETGGFLVSDTNALAGALRAAREDLGAFYLVEYAPANELFDGRFRRIEVRVRRSSVHLQARRGYFAVRTRTPTPVLDFEAPVLAALELAPHADELPFVAAALRFPGEDGESVVPVVVEVPGEAATTTTDAEGSRFQIELTALVLVRDAAGSVVRKLSRRFVHGGAAAELAALRRGRMVLLRETWLAPGRYQVEVAVRDAASGRLGVRRLPLEVPDESSRGLRVSSLAVVGHTEKTKRDAPDSAALVVGDLQIHPTPAGVFSASAGKPIPFFLEVRMTAGRAPARGVVALLREDGSPLSEGEIALAPDEGHGARILRGVRLDGVPAGTYELRVTIEDDVERASRAALVRVEP